MKTIILILVVLVSASAIATDSIPVASPPLGRLFFSPAERAERDSVRTTSASPATDSRQVQRLDGVIQRNSKPIMLWVDGELYPLLPEKAGHKKQPAAPFVSTPLGALNTQTLEIHSNGRTIKIGETMLPNVPSSQN